VSSTPRRRARRAGANGDERSVTLQDVATRAGVSLATASRVLAGGARRVGDEISRRVTRAATELGYTANLQARAVATGRSNLVGVVVHDIADPYFSSVAAGLMEVLHARDLAVTLSATLGDPTREREYVALARAQRARGLVLVGTRVDDDGLTTALRREVDLFQRGGGRAVCIGQDQLGTDTVVPENEAGARKLAQALVQQGYKRFAVLAGPKGWVTARDRLRGFSAGLRRSGIELDDAHVAYGPFDRDGAYEAMSAVLAMRIRRPFCVFAVNDVMAVGALSRARAERLAVPGDIAIAGFDDIPTLRDVHPPLTTVRLPLAAMGRMAAEALLHDEAAPARVMPVAGEVVLRESTTRLPRR
jgi:LacI family transcriptional regulator